MKRYRATFTQGPWTCRRYGYERHSICDINGIEIGLAHRRGDALLISLAPQLYGWAARVLGDLSGHSDDHIEKLQREGEILVAIAQGIEARKGGDADAAPSKTRARPRRGAPKPSQETNNG